MATINYKQGLNEEQKQSIATLVANKPTASWTDTDKQNWNYATNNSAMPLATAPGTTEPIAPAAPSISAVTPVGPVAPAVTTAPSFYRVKNATTGVDDLYDASTKTLLKPTEFTNNYSTKGAKEVPLPTSPSSPITNGVPTGSANFPTLPDPTATTEASGFIGSIQSAVDTATKALADSYATQIAALDAKNKAAQASIDAIAAKQGNALDAASALTQPFRADLEATERERLSINENFQANQALTNELQGLLTEGNILISSMKGVTGLAGIRNPRVNEAIDAVNARAGVISAVMAARNSQINVAETMIDRTVSAITADRNDRIGYYNSLLSFYGSEKATAQTTLKGIETDQKTFLNAQIGLLENKVKETKETANYVKGLMINPETAAAVAKAGVTLNDSVEVINKKLATYADNKDFNDQVNKLKDDGYEYLAVVPSSMTDVVSFVINGKTVYFKKPKNETPGAGFTLNEGDKRYDASGKLIASFDSTDTNSPASGTVTTKAGDAYNIGKYATDPNHEVAVQNILNNIGQFKTVTDIDAYIKKVAPKSPITGEMVIEASEKYGVSWEMMTAIMQQDSSFGTAGKGARTYNPGNVGNTDSGAEVNYGNWQSGVDAVADWLSKNKATGATGYDAFAQEQIALSVLPVQIRNTEKELARFQKGIREGLAQGKTPYEVADMLMGYQITNPDEFSDTIRGFISQSDKLDASDPANYARLINAGEKEKVITKMETKILGGMVSDGKKKEAVAYYSSTKGDEAIKLLEDNLESAGIIAGNWNKQKSKFVKSEDFQKMSSALTATVSAWRKEMAGSATTTTELEMLDGLIAKVTDNPFNAIEKIKELQSMTLAEANAQRTVANLPLLDKNSLTSNYLRVGLYSAGASNASWDNKPTTDLSQFEQ